MNYLAKILSVLFFTLMVSCKNNMNVSTPPPLSTYLVGKWEWIKTIDESGKITTPQILGYGKSMSLGNSYELNGDYIYIVENGKEVKVLLENHHFGKVEKLEDTLKIFSQFGNEYVEFSLLKNSNNVYPELIRTDLVKDYTKGLGQTRHYYKLVGPPDKP